MGLVVHPIVLHVLCGFYGQKQAFHISTRTTHSITRLLEPEVLSFLFIRHGSGLDSLYGKYFYFPTPRPPDLVTLTFYTACFTAKEPIAVRHSHRSGILIWCIYTLVPTTWRRGSMEPKISKRPEDNRYGSTRSYYSSRRQNHRISISHS